MERKSRTSRAEKEVIKNVTRLTTSAVDSIISSLIVVSPFDMGSKVKSAYLSIKEELFNEKLEAFLSGQNITAGAKEAFLKHLASDTESFFKRLFVVLDRLDGAEKASIIGKLFGSLVLQKINVEEFHELTAIIENCYIKDIHYLFREYSKKPIFERAERPWRPANLPLRKLASQGILNHEVMTSGPLQSDTFELTSVGKKLILYGRG